MTYRERRLAKAERLRDWAESRERKAAAGFERARAIADNIPFGQPILVGHHSEGRARRDAERIHNGMRAGIENARMADDMRSGSANIEAAASRAIYSDDADAADRLRERIAELEASRARIKAYNAACRRAGKATPEALALLDAAERAGLDSVTRYAPYQLGRHGEMPGYALSNLGGNIGRLRERLHALENPRPTWFHASRRDPDVCYKCDERQADHTPHATVPSVLMCPVLAAAGRD